MLFQLRSCSCLCSWLSVAAGTETACSFFRSRSYRHRLWRMKYFVQKQTWVLSLLRKERQRWCRNIPGRRKRYTPSLTGERWEELWNRHFRLFGFIPSKYSTRDRGDAARHGFCAIFISTVGALRSCIFSAICIRMYKWVCMMWLIFFAVKTFFKDVLHYVRLSLATYVPTLRNILIFIN